MCLEGLYILSGLQNLMCPRISKDIISFSFLDIVLTVYIERSLGLRFGM